MAFNKDFVWGAATAAYQIEGAAFEDGKGLSIWDVYSRQPGKVHEGHTGDIACDHYHRYKEDVNIMKEIGIKAYRFSIAWSRILPNGIGEVNEKGLAFYSDLIDTLIEAGITPYITLYHWDLPYELYKKGGWMNRDIVDWFGEYTRVVVERYSDRVRHWITINEPQCFIGLGYQQGRHAPFLTLPTRDVLQAAHNTLMAHGQAVKVIRKEAKTKPSIGFAPVGNVSYPINSQDDKLVEATRKEMFRSDSGSVMNAAWWADPIFLGKYPEDGVNTFGEDMPNIYEGDMELIAQPLDFYGINIYSGSPCDFDEQGKLFHTGFPVAHPTTAMGWHVAKEALYWGVRYVYERYHVPVLVTENGMANTDWVMEDGCVHDAQRIDFLSQYIGALEKATDDGVAVDGYFQWSLMDNYEWAFGYDKRFGMVHVDYATQKRTLKDSAYWYRDFIKAHS